MIAAVSPQRNTEPQPPRSSTVQPSDPRRKPGFASARTNPSYQRRVLMSCRSSTTAYATATSLLRQFPFWSIGSRPYQGRRTVSTFREGPLQTGGADNTIVSDEAAANHHQLRVRRDRECSLRRALGVRALRPALEHPADSGGGVRGPAPPNATPQAARARIRYCRGGGAGPAHRLRQRQFHLPRTDSGLPLDLPLSAFLAAQRPARGGERAALGASSRVTCRPSGVNDPQETPRRPRPRPARSCSRRSRSASIQSPPSLPSTPR